MQGFVVSDAQGQVARIASEARADQPLVTLRVPDRFQKPPPAVRVPGKLLDVKVVLQLLFEFFHRRGGKFPDQPVRRQYHHALFLEVGEVHHHAVEALVAR